MTEYYWTLSLSLIMLSEILNQTIAFWIFLFQSAGKSSLVFAMTVTKESKTKLSKIKREIKILIFTTLLKIKNKSINQIA